MLRGAWNTVGRFYLGRYPQVRIGRSSRVRWDRIHGLTRDSTLEVGSDCVCHCRIAFDRGTARVVIGNRTYVGASSLVAAQEIVIGDDVLVSWGVTIVDHDSHSLHFPQRQEDVRLWKSGRKDWTHVPQKPVRVGDKSWLGFNAIVLKGVTVGEGSVVAAGSVVTKDVPPWSVVAGNPAKVIRELERPDR